ncbi:hypothetical protein [Emticicia sp. 21SJ11W-3]|uniref:hypothetical protein n=1 Tax=Emticicia sp. 21SJ11W-3 TaxID=2916755 RepID=UPI00209EBC33|nr:hypothetical protein [Emticicia sp. 21SJ11W-3]UTA66672.1 hypothetical protein MB380_13785 [Emticicia sp. 21SJ11W-3]
MKTSFFFFAFLCVVGWQSCFAQDTTVKSLEALYKQYVASKPDSAVEPAALDSLDSAITAAIKSLQFESVKVAHDHYVQQLAYTQKVYDFQALSSRIIFTFVLLIVFCGLAFAAIQFYKSMKVVNKEDPTNVEISLSGVKVSSSILGAIILVISLAFFYLYLIYVYPIKQVDTEPKGRPQEVKK